jgi:hypothetical protein
MKNPNTPMIVYGLVDSSEPSIVRYVGKTKAATKHKRLSVHLVKSRQGERTHKANWLRKGIIYLSANHE